MYEPLGTRTIEAKPLIEALLKLINTREFLTNFDLRTIDQDDALKENDRILIGTTEGNQAISIKDFYFALLDSMFRHRDKVPRAIARRMFYRGKNLGTEVTERQWLDIETSGYWNLFVGDYWVINGVKYVIMDFDYLTMSYVYGPHLLMMPESWVIDETVLIVQDSVVKGYVGSYMHTRYLPNTILPKLVEAFGEDHLFKWIDYLSTAVDTTQGIISGAAWTYDIKVCLPTTEMLTGHSGNGWHSINSRSNTQLAACMIDRHDINPTGKGFWLREALAADRWAVMDGNGNIGGGLISDKYHVRPFFAIH